MVDTRLGGWHRLWIVASILWAVWVLFQFVPQWNQLNPKPSWQPPPSATASLDPAKQAKLEALRKKLSSLASLRGLEHPRRDLLVSTMVRLVVPIASAYGAGWAFIWIRRGFAGQD